ncbi:MAG: tetratricopeptide repeat protein [Clostridium chrysemydis]|uniref:tetratricopeptide repeat protein n=1 Tax=Clostridium chrysemydis TaxID=2665504 RepID=UPI003F40BFEE
MGFFDIFKKKKATNSEINSAWQNIVCGETNTLLNKEDLLELTNIYIEERTRVIIDCLDIINSTTSIDVYFSRYNLIIEKLNELSLLEAFVPFKDPKPSLQLQEISLKKDLKSKEILERSWNNTKLKTLDFKTSTAKSKNINKFFETAYTYVDSFGPKSTQLLAEIKKESEYLISNDDIHLKSNIRFDEFEEKTLLSNLNNSNDAYNRHFIYIDLQNFYYKYRNLDKSYLNKCIEYCLLDINSLEQMNYAYIQQQIKMEKEVMKYVSTKSELQKRIKEIKDTGFDANIPAFKRLAIIYENKKDYEKAIQICQKAIECGQESDGTKNGFKGRLEKLNNKIK